MGRGDAGTRCAGLVYLVVQKIKYMFPKAHAAAYVMMAFRIAWYKIFIRWHIMRHISSIRASAFSYELMCQGQEKLLHYMDEYRKKAMHSPKRAGFHERHEDRAGNVCQRL